MPRIIKPLTAKTIDALKPGQKSYLKGDGQVPGLSIIVLPNGTKSWRFKKLVDGVAVRVSLGMYPDVSLSDARSAARDLKIKKPEPEKKRVMTVAEVSEAFISWKESVSRTPATLRKYRECLKNDILPAFGDRDIAEIHTPEVVQFLELIDRRSNSLASKNKELIGMLIRYAMQRGYRQPYTHLDLSGIVPRRAVREKKMIQADQVRWESVESCRSPVMRCAIKLQFLCFLRSSELMGGRWDEIEGSVWTVQGNRMKMRRPHVVPLSSQALAVLSDLRQLTGGTPYLFPSLHTASHMTRDALSKIFRDLDLGLHPHACRTLFSTWARNSGFSPHAVEAQLAHVEGNQVAAAYMHAPHLMYFEERKKMMQAWADHVMHA